MVCKNCDISFQTLSKAKAADLEARLRCNHRASSLESAQFADLLSEVKNDYFRCDTEISRLHSMIIHLENKRGQLKRRMEGYQSLVSPIRRLPTEVLTNIFFRCCGNNELTHSAGEPWLTSALSLGMVCAYWREIMLSTPQLWSVISITAHFHPYTTRPRIELLDLYLERSRQLPLTLVIDDGPEGGLPDEVIDRLVHHSHRWRDVEASLGLEHKSLVPLANKLPLLEKLSIGGCDEFDADYDVFQSLPALHTLALGGEGPNALRFPWGQIKHLRRESCTVSQFTGALDRCRNVVTAELLRFTEEFDEGISRGATSELHTLSLQMDRDAWFGISTLFDVLTLPAMASLSISHVYPSIIPHGLAWPADAFTSFVSRSSCPLTSLSLKRMPLSEIQLLDVLRSLPLLTNLTIQDTPPLDLPFPVDRFPVDHTVTDTFIQSMNINSTTSLGSSSSPFLPNLQHLDLELRGSAFKDEGFVDMVKSRWSPPGSVHEPGQISSLQSVTLRVMEREFDTEKFEALRHLSKSGMKIFISGADAS